ncbi:MAG: peptidylprolyl isomerase [Myxococcaceae bacterium]|nr:peptidylprolyl isomerase [Myxococcaceae bacterium]
MTTIANDSVVAFDYTLRDGAGAVIDSSQGGSPMVYLHGHGNIVAGLEEALHGKTAGASLKVTVKPEDGYGEWREELVMKVARSRLPKSPEPKVGLELQGVGPGGEPLHLRVIAIEGDQISLDANHPLAGQELHFEVSIQTVRAASEEELAHGHVHGHGGAHH